MSRLERRTLEITTNIGCTVRCAYCPQERLLSAYDGPMLMGLDVFKACLGKLPKDAGVHFSGMSEPWLNPRCTEMVTHACAAGFSVTVYTTLVGMTPHDVLLLKRQEFRDFLVHLPSVRGGENIVLNDAYLLTLEKVARGIQAVFLRFGELPGPVAEIVPERMTRLVEIKARAGNLRPVKWLPGPIRCSRSMHRNVLLPDGRVLLCCQDYGMRHVLGDLLEQDYGDVAHGPEMFRVLAATSAAGDVLCRTCELAVRA